MAKKIQVKDRKPIIRDAMLYYYLEFESDVLTSDDIKRLLAFADLDLVPDRVIMMNEAYQNNLDWNSLSNSKISRLISMFLDIGDIDFILSNVELKKKDFSIREVQWCLYRKPELTELFRIDLKRLSKHDAYKLLKMGHAYFADRINIQRYRFNTTEIYNIVKAYDFDRRVMMLVKSHQLEGFHISEALIQTGKENIGLLKLEKMNASHWVNVLERRRTLFDLCDLNIFMKEDVFHSIKLMSLFPTVDLHDYIKNNLQAIGDKGWEILLIHFPDYAQLCDVNQLYAGTWNKILDQQPLLESLRPRVVKSQGLAEL